MPLNRTEKRLIHTVHLDDMLRHRAIDIDEVEYAIANANTELPGKNPGTTRIISNMGFGRRLSVVFKEKEAVLLLITAYWVERR